MSASARLLNLTSPSTCVRVPHHSANGDGFVSIPEFSAFMTGNTNTFDALRSAEAVVEEETPPARGMSHMMLRAHDGRAGSRAMMQPADSQDSWGGGTRPLTWRDKMFIDRMTNDLEECARTRSPP